ncbi:MAG: hypothetical protein ACOC8M_02790, partial [Guyparkeria sp.]
MSHRDANARHPAHSGTPSARWVPTGDVDIDRVRRDVASTPTTADSLWERVDAIWAWMVLLQRLEVDLTPILPVLDRLEVKDIEQAPPDVLAAVDEAYAVLGRLQARAGLRPKPAPAEGMPAGPVRA